MSEQEKIERLVEDIQKRIHGGKFKTPDALKSDADFLQLSAGEQGELLGILEAYLQSRGGR